MNDLIERLPTIAKAVAAFIALLVPFLTAISTALVDGHVDPSEWAMIATAFAALVAGTKAVYQVRNLPMGRVK